MALDVRTSPPGAALLAALAQSVADMQGGDPLAPVTVVVPTNGIGVATRRALARRRPIGNVRFLTAPRLAEALGRERVGDRAPVSVPLLEGALRATLREAPGRFADVADHASTVAALRQCYRNLREVPDVLVRRIEQLGSPLGRETARVVRATHERLRRRWFDSVDVFGAAVHALRDGARADSPVVVYLPERDEPGSATLVSELAARGPVTVLAGLTGDALADTEVRSWLTRLGALPVDPPREDGVGHVDLVTTSDLDDEVRAAVREVVERARAGVPLHRIALVWSSHTPYARLVTDRLRAAAVPFHGTDPVAVAERVAGRTLLGLLDVDRLDWRREDVFALLAGAPLRLPSGAAVPTVAWERVSREAGVHRGSHWDQHLARYRDDELADAARRGLAEGSRQHHNAARADALRRFVADLTRDLGPRHTPDRWAGWARRGHDLLERYVGGDAVRAALDPAEQRAFDRVQAALDRLADLDAVAAPVSRPVFREVLLAELETDLGRAGVAGTGVLVGPLGVLVGADVDVVVAVGASDATLPGGVPFDPLLGEQDRRLAEGWLAPPDAPTRRARRALAVALAAVDDVVVTMPRGDLRQSVQRRPSPWVDDLVPAGARHDREVASFVAGVESAAFPATALEHRLRALVHHVRGGGTLTAHPLARHDDALRRAVRLVEARRSPLFTEYDGDLSSLPRHSPIEAGTPLSVTRLEAWALCPHRYLFERMLGVEVVENPEDVLAISPMDRGNLLHAVLDRFNREVLAGELPMPRPDEPWPVPHRRRLLALLEQEADRVEAAGLAGRPTLWRRERSNLRTLLQWWLARDDQERRQGGLTLVASEQRFGDGEAWPAAEVGLPDGRVVRFGGIIDRVDRAEHGGYRVVDHKASRSSRFEQLPSTIHQGGTKLQLLVYAAALRTAFGDAGLPVHAEYSFLRSDSAKASVGYDVTPQHTAALQDALGVIVGGIEAGLFPAHPEAPGFRLFVECPFCDPDELGTTTRYREWLGKRTDPRLAPYVALRDGVTEEDDA